MPLEWSLRYWILKKTWSHELGSTCRIHHCPPGRPGLDLCMGEWKNLRVKNRLESDPLRNGCVFCPTWILDVGGSFFLSPFDRPVHSMARSSAVAQRGRYLIIGARLEYSYGGFRRPSRHRNSSSQCRLSFHSLASLEKNSHRFQEEFFFGLFALGTRCLRPLRHWGVDHSSTNGNKRDSPPCTHWMSPLPGWSGKSFPCHPVPV
jgi:hypothetical protein